MTLYGYFTTGEPDYKLPFDGAAAREEEQLEFRAFLAQRSVNAQRDFEKKECTKHLDATQSQRTITQCDGPKI